MLLEIMQGFRFAVIYLSFRLASVHEETFKGKHVLKFFTLDFEVIGHGRLLVFRTMENDLK